MVDPKDHIREALEAGSTIQSQLDALFAKQERGAHVSPQLLRRLDDLLVQLSMHEALARSTL